MVPMRGSAVTFHVAQDVALVAVRRDWETCVFLAGLLLNVVLNNALKAALREPRPLHPCASLAAGGGGADGANVFDVGSFEEFGMPSNHAQFMAFAAAFTTLVLAFRCGREPRWERLGIAGAAWVAAGLCSYSRVHLHYHTAPQVLAGTAVGALAGLAWFGCYAAWLAPLGRRLVGTRLFRALRVREASRVPNVLEAEYAALGPTSAKIVSLSLASGGTSNATGAGDRSTAAWSWHPGDEGSSSAGAVARALRPLRADVVCLQDAADAPAVAALLRMSCVVVRANGGSDGSSGPTGHAILSRWPLHSVERIELPLRGGGGGDRSSIRGDPLPCVGVAAVVSPVPLDPGYDFRVVSTPVGVVGNVLVAAAASGASLEPARAIRAYYLKQSQAVPAVLAASFNPSSSAAMFDLDHEWSGGGGGGGGSASGSAQGRRGHAWTLARHYALPATTEAHGDAFAAPRHRPFVAEWVASS
jgi:dolichyldiphosphatase